MAKIRLNRGWNMLKINVRFSWIRICFAKNHFNSFVPFCLLGPCWSNSSRWFLGGSKFLGYSWAIRSIAAFIDILDPNPSFGQVLVHKTQNGMQQFMKITVSKSLKGFLLQPTACQEEQICSSNSEIIERYSPPWVGWQMRSTERWNRSYGFRIQKEKKYFWWTWRRIQSRNWSWSPTRRSIRRWRICWKRKL